MGDSGRGDRRGERCDSSGVRRGFSVPSSSLRCSRLPLRGRRAVVSSSPGLSLILCGPGWGGGRKGAGRDSGGAGGGPRAGAVLSTGRGGGRGEEVRDKTRGEQARERGRGEQVRDGGVGVEGRDIEGGGERLLRRPHCSLFSLLLTVDMTWVKTHVVAARGPVYKLDTVTTVTGVLGKVSKDTAREDCRGNRECYCTITCDLWVAVESFLQMPQQLKMS